jgi:uncharacterized coiled-coil protein SlyX
MSDEQIGEKLVRMESLVTHLERQYEELNKVVLEQGKALAKLTNQHERIADSLLDIRQDEIRRDTRKPPHYQ